MAKMKTAAIGKAGATSITPDMTVEQRIKHDTIAWVRNKADERAVAAGMIFDSTRGQYVCDWIERECYLYQGAAAGQPLKLMPYQRDYVMRLFSWVQWSPEWGEYIRRFTNTNLLCPKKNGKTPLEAAIGLYLTCADGEQGNNVYQLGKNGKQAGLAQANAVNMVRQSPRLRAECTINKTTMRIAHTASNSSLSILAGDDSRASQANEGINGSIMIDELHVFDRELHERTAGAGISRKEPLNVAVSTAGDDPSCFGYERTEYGRAVNNGDRDDLHFLHVEYSAPQKATDQEIEENLLEYGKLANPAWGYIIKETEFKAAYEKAKGNPRAMARFKQYRLNIWVGSVSPWLNVAHWDACRATYTLDDFRGSEFNIGIDLSRTRDMTAVVLRFKCDEIEEGLSRIWPMFWLPEEIAEARKHLFPYMEWVEKGYLKLIPGNVVDFSVIEEDIVNLIEEYEMNCLTIYFDQKYAEEITQRLEERLGCERVAVGQTLMTLSPLCKDLERLVDSHMIQHPGNDVLTWQAGHVQVYTDRNLNIRPHKPDPNSGKCIDGIAALIDTLAADSEEQEDSSGAGLSFV